jgi:hypothetical protein
MKSVSAGGGEDAISGTGKKEIFGTEFQAEEG